VRAAPRHDAVAAGGRVARMSLLDAAVRWGLPLVPRPVLWSVAKRYVAGDRLEAALARIEQVRGEGFGAIADVLGEGVEDRDGAHAARDEYLRLVDALDAVDETCVVSVKPTHLGLLVDEGLCEAMLEELCARCAPRGRLVRFEMEDAPTIDGTLSVYRRVRARHDNVGCVLQSRLFRTADDVEALLDGPPLDVRLVKGIYLEPPSIAWTDREPIRQSYVRLGRRLLEGGARVGFATHDDALADAVRGMLEELGLRVGGERYEFQCLMGVRAPYARALRDEGHRVRIYVPYGRDWRPYTLRRLRHNPEIARHVLRALVRGER